MIEDIIKKRRSIRTYTAKPISQEDLDKILDAAILSPSAKNMQPWEYLIVTGKPKQNIADAIEKALNHPNPTSNAIRECSHLILVYNTIDDYFSHLSIGASIENMLLTATSLGIGSLWIGYILKVSDTVKEITNNSHELVSAIALGYSAESPDPRPRKAKEEVVKYLNNR